MLKRLVIEDGDDQLSMLRFGKKIEVFRTPDDGFYVGNLQPVVMVD